MKRALCALVTVLLFACFAYAQDVHSGWTRHFYNGIHQGCRGCHIPHGGSVATSGIATRVTVWGTGGVNDYSTGTYKLWDKNLSTWRLPNLQ